MIAALPEIEITEKPITEYIFFKKIIEKPFVEAVYLYGSRARGDHTEHSDYDLGVICTKASEKEWKEIDSLARNNKELLVRVDIVRLDANTKQPFLSYIIRDRELLYIRDFADGDIDLQINLDFIKNWDKKMLGWTHHLHKLIDKKPQPDDEELTEIFSSFKSSFDCAWVLYRKCLVLHGMRTNTPLSSFREAYMEGWITDRPVWEAMVHDYYNTLDEKDIEAKHLVYKRLPLYIKTLAAASKNINKLIKPFEYEKKK